jgi:3-oxoacyl-[acyl-carrier protein] reductase
MTARSLSALAGKAVIVTGAGHGIGEAIARLFASEGARVTVNSRTPADVERVVADITGPGGTAHGIVADIGGLEGVQAVVQGTVARFGAVDILVHNAGIYPFQPVETMEDRDWNRVLEVNLTSAFRLTTACLPHMKGRSNGRLLFTSSVMGRVPRRRKSATRWRASYRSSAGGRQWISRTRCSVSRAKGQATSRVRPSSSMVVRSCRRMAP